MKYVIINKFIGRGTSRIVEIVKKRRKKNEEAKASLNLPNRVKLNKKMLSTNDKAHLLRLKKVQSYCNLAIVSNSCVGEQQSPAPERPGKEKNF